MAKFSTGTQGKARCPKTELLEIDSAGYLTGWRLFLSSKQQQGSQQQEVKFQGQILENFRTISGHFCWFHEAKDTENARFSVLINVNH